ncbi:MAG: hypothetical protein WC471_05845 [Candidatus Woesearchaeota archaeon]
MKNILLIGEGEVGSALKRIEEEAGNKVYVLDLKYLTKPDASLGYDVCHVNIPYSERFIEIVDGYAKSYNPGLLIINSTVPLGVTSKVRKATKLPTVHSPIRGVHPNLYEGVKTFSKIIGGVTKDTKLADEHFVSIGLKTAVYGSSKESELAKLLCTTYYGWNILFAKQVSLMCKKYGLNYDNVYKDFNISYNEGYSKLGKSNVVRPVLVPPEGLIGGHCVGNNFELLPRSKLKKFAKKMNEDHSL